MLTQASDAQLWLGPERPMEQHTDRRSLRRAPSLESATAKPIWTKPYEWFGDEGLGITSALALRDEKTDAIRGVFTADYHLGALADFLAILKIGNGGRAYLLGRSGDLLASPDRGAIVSDPLLATAIEKSEAALAGGIQTLTVDQPQSFPFRHEGRAYIAAVEAFQPAEGLPVVLSTLASTFQKRRLVRALNQRKRNLQPCSTDKSLQKTSIVLPVSAPQESEGNDE